MAFKHGKDAEVSIDGVAFTGYCDDLSYSSSNDTAEVTVFGNDWKQFLSGLNGATLDGSGHYDPSSPSGPILSLFGILGGDPVACLYYPGGNVAGQIEIGFDAILTSFEITSSVSDKVSFSYSLLVTDAVTAGVVSA